MEYLLIDSHQRFLGTLRSDRSFCVGDIFQNDKSQSYTVVGVNWSNRLQTSATHRKALTVVATSRQVPVAHG
jgi:hypothetical protein